MNDSATIDYGPLKGLVGVWQGDKGLDISPEPDGAENTPYYETITFSAIGDVSNAETQRLAALHYRQIVQRKSNDEIFHDETGYWMWDDQAQLIMHSLTIPRAVSVLAGGKYIKDSQAEPRVVLEVSASLEDTDWSIIQSPFMRDHARTTRFNQRLCIENDTLSYSETTIVEIYGKVFEHSDGNELTRQS